MFKFPRAEPGEPVSWRLFNRLVDELQRRMNLHGVGRIDVEQTPSGQIIRVKPYEIQSAIRIGVVQTNPDATDNLTINLVDAQGAVLTSGAEANLTCYGLIYNGTRLDMALPRLSIGDIVFVRPVNVAPDKAAWYFTFPFNGTEDYTA